MKSESDISEEQIEIIHRPILSESFKIKPMCVCSGLFCPSFFEKPIKPAVKPVQKRRPIIWISLEPHFVNVSPFRHHWSPFVTILSPPLLLFYSKFIWIFIFLTPRLTCVRGCSRSDSKPPLSNHVANCVALQSFKLQNWIWKLRDKCRRITFQNCTVRFLDFWSIILTVAKIGTEFWEC